jgi:hypothetical protein
MKEYKYEKHYSTRDSQYESIRGQLRNNKIETLKKVLTGQQTLFFKKRLEAGNIVWANFVVSEIIAKHSKSYTDGEFVKECLVAVVDISYPSNSNDMHTMSCSEQAH